MDSTTQTDLTFLQNEEAARTFIQFATPLIQAAVRDAMPVEWLEALAAFKQTQDTLNTVKEELAEVRATFITAEQAASIGRDIGAEIREPLKLTIDRHLRELSEEDEKRNRAFNVRIGEVQALALETQQRATETDSKLATLEATSLQRFEQIERRLARAETDIDRNVKKVAQSAETMNLTFSKFLSEYEKQAKQNAGDIADLKAIQSRTDKRLEETRDDALNLRGDIDGLRSDIATKVTTTDLKVKHIEAQMLEVKQNQAEQRTDLIALNTAFNEFQIQLKSAMWLLNSWAGRAVLFTVLALLGISNLVN